MPEQRPVFPVHRFEVEAVDATRVLLTVHYFSTPEDFAKNRPSLMNFLVPISGVSSLADMLKRVAQKMA
jgi:hypothetical protein